jgi:hypothetical protein
MKKLVPLSLAVLFALACSEPTASTSNLDLAYGKKTPTPLPDAPATCPANFSCATFEGFDISAAAAEVGISTTTKMETAPGGQSFAGRHVNETLTLTPASTAQATVTFNLYIIGSWIGDPKKGDPQTWQLAYQCGTNPEVLVVNSSFSNAIGNYQSYPDAITAKGKLGHHGGQYGAVTVNALQYAGSGLTNYTTKTGDVADSEYAIQKVIPSCGALSRSIYMRGKNLNGNVNEASWGVDNISVQ